MDPRDPEIVKSFSSSKGAPSELLKQFYKGEPLALGITQIFIGILEITCGLLVEMVDRRSLHDISFKISYCPGILLSFMSVFCCSVVKQYMEVVSNSSNRATYSSGKDHTLAMSVPNGIVGLFLPGRWVWKNNLYIISGSLSVAAARNPRISLVKGMLGMNIVSAVAAGIGLVSSSLFMNYQIPPRRSDSWCASHTNDTKLIQVCQENSFVPYATVYNVIAMLLALTILEFGITIVSTAFGCASVCRNNYRETTIIIFQNTAEDSVPSQQAP